MGTITSGVNYKSEELYNRLVRRSVKKDVSMSSIVCAALERYLDEEEEHDIEVFIKHLDKDEIIKLNNLLQKKRESE